MTDAIPFVLQSRRPNVSANSSDRISHSFAKRKGRLPYSLGSRISRKTDAPLLRKPSLGAPCHRARPTSFLRREKHAMPLRGKLTGLPVDSCFASAKMSCAPSMPVALAAACSISRPSMKYFNGAGPLRRRLRRILFGDCKPNGLDRADSGRGNVGCADARMQ